MIRYYKGKYKVIRISDVDPSHKACYRVLEAFAQHEVNDLIISPVRLCWRRKK